MKKTLFLLALISIFFLSIPFIYSHSPGSLNDQQREFNQFKQQESEEFDQYYKEIQEEFKEYKRIVNEEYKKYKDEILKNWDKADITDNKKWVEYSSDYKTKRIVDFEQGFIELDIIVDDLNNKEVEKKFKNILKDLLLEDKRTAFERDKLAQNIEKKITKKAKHVKTDKVKKKPILTPIFIDNPEPTKKEVDKAVSDLLKKSKIKKKPASVKGTAKNKGSKKKDQATLKVSLPSDSILKRANTYKPVVDNYANEYNVERPLVFAIIHTESAFNPMAKSPVPAYGLMQIVPSTAGKDATKMIYGKPMLVSPSYLYNDENNIKLGSAYIHILFYKYLKNIKNEESRLYCSIAAYNTGAGNVAKAFTGSKNLSKAIKVINKLPPQEVYDKLIVRLPYDETKHYLKRVSKRIEMYKNL